MASASVAFLQLSGCATVAVCAAAATAYSLRVRSGHGPDQRGDSVFWNSFLGLVLLLPAVLIPAVFVPAAGVGLFLLAVIAGAAAYFGGPRLDGRRRRRRLELTAAQSLAAAGARHHGVLARWQRYELDPGAMIDYPQMSDVRQPATAALVRAMREAERAREAPAPDYGAAVARLELLLAEAERAAGVPAEAAAVPPLRGRRLTAR